LNVSEHVPAFTYNLNYLMSQHNQKGMQKSTSYLNFVNILIYRIFYPINFILYRSEMKKEKNVEKFNDKNFSLLVYQETERERCGNVTAKTHHPSTCIIHVGCLFRLTTSSWMVGAHVSIRLRKISFVENLREHKYGMDVLENQYSIYLCYSNYIYSSLLLTVFCDVALFCNDFLWNVVCVNVLWKLNAMLKRFWLLLFVIIRKFLCRYMSIL